MFQRTARQVPDRGIGYIQDDGAVVFQSYAQLLDEAARVCAGLQQREMVAGEPVIVALARNEEFVPAFWGCVLGGLLPVLLAPPPSLSRPSTALDKLSNVWRALGEPPVVLPVRLCEASSDSPEVPSMPATKRLSLTALRQAPPATVMPPARDSDTVLLQFSSGSTGQPKGVRLTHHNVLSNLRAFIASIRGHRDDVGLSWLPLWHDMGLIGLHLAPVHEGANHFLLDTLHFIKRPLLWLESLERYGATITRQGSEASLLLSRQECFCHST